MTTQVPEPMISAPLGALVHLSSQTASSSPAVDFTSGIDATYARYMLSFSEVKVATDDVAILMQVSTDGGTSWVSTSSYGWSGGGLIWGHNYQVTMSNGDTSIPLVHKGRAGMGIGTAAGESLSGYVEIWNPASTSAFTDFLRQTVYVCSEGNSGWTAGSGSYLATSDVNGIRIQADSGNIASGTFNLYGVAAG